MSAGARTPEELETLFEDAFVLGDRQELGALFDDGGVLAVAGGEARGRVAIARAAGELWVRGETYVGGPRRVVQARDTALIVTRDGVHVVSRRHDGTWRLAISLLVPPIRTTEEET